jgi:predicted dienelactone hydrolase
LVVISHGLWDSPASFEGWGRHLASHGYDVLLPTHPGSDSSQQEEMLSGRVPPPSPEELRLRPLDVIAILDAVEAGELNGLAGVDTRHVVVVGHSWGATTALQLAGLRSSSTLLRKLCDDLDNPERNMSWVLQCSFLNTADQAALADRRVIAVVAVSPPLRLLFDRGAAEGMNARGLVVSGSDDWVVPPDPEALLPFREQTAERGHRLVLAKGGDHFNLRPGPEEAGVLGALILGWTNGAFAAGELARPSASGPSFLPDRGWGNDLIPLVNATPRLPRS